MWEALITLFVLIFFALLLLIGLCAIAFIILLIIFLDRWINKKKKLLVGIATGSCCALIAAFLIGAILSLEMVDYAEQQYIANMTPEEREAYIVAHCSHTYEMDEYILNPTCTMEGSCTYICTKCNNRKTEPVSATGHTMKQVSSDAEKIVHKCEICGEEKIEMLKSDATTGETAVSKNTMLEQFMALGFTKEEAIKVQEIFTTVGITEINNIQAVGNAGIDSLQAFKCGIYDSHVDKGGALLLFTVEKRQLCHMSLNGFYNTITMKYDSATLYDVWDENGEIIPNAIGYKAVLDYENKKIIKYEG